MTRRERVLKVLAFEETECPPLDLRAFLSPGISVFAYPALVEALGLPPRPPRVHHTSRMLARPDLDAFPVSSSGRAAGPLACGRPFVW